MKFKQYNNLLLFIKRHFYGLLPFLNIAKTYNIIISLIERKFRRTKCWSRPYIYRVEPCSLCNLNCVSCETNKIKTNEKRIMEYEDYKIIINKIKKYSLRISLYDMGEPLINKDIYKFIKHTSDNNISSLISTNFNLFKKEDLKPLFDSKLTVLEPCLDGFSQEKYSKYRCGGNVDIVKNGIEDVMKYKKINKVSYPIVDVQVIEFDHIKDEIPKIIEFLKKNKVDKITLRQENLGYNSNETGLKKYHKTKNQSCFWLYLGMMIRPDGNVYPCCGCGFDRFSYGNIYKDSLNNIWNNKYYKFSRKLFQRGKNIKYDSEMKKIPCLGCTEFKKLRIMENK